MVVLAYTLASQFYFGSLRSNTFGAEQAHQARTHCVLDRARATHLRGGLCAAFGIKTIKPMEVASICSGNGIASSLHGAMLSAQSRDFGMLDTLS